MNYMYHWKKKQPTNFEFHVLWYFKITKEDIDNENDKPQIMIWYTCSNYDRNCIINEKTKATYFDVMYMNVELPKNMYCQWGKLSHGF